MPFEWKPSILLYAYLLGHQIPDNQKEDFLRLLRLSPFLLDQMIDTGLEIDAMFRQRRIPKRVGMMPIYLMIQLHQQLVQGMFSKQDAFV